MKTVLIQTSQKSRVLRHAKGEYMDLAVWVESERALLLIDHKILPARTASAALIPPMIRTSRICHGAATAAIWSMMGSTEEIIVRQIQSLAVA